MNSEVLHLYTALTYVACALGTLERALSYGCPRQEPRDLTRFSGSSESSAQSNQNSIQSTQTSSGGLFTALAKVACALDALAKSSESR